MKKHLNLLVLLLAFTFIVTSCKDDDDNSEDVDTRFEQELVGTDNMELLKDTETGLTWVNDTRGCFAGIVTPADECANLTFAGSTDWRTPSPEEMAALITAIDERNMTLNYINTSCALMATNMPTWVMTENSNNPGQTTTTMPGNAGLRCVRN